MSLEKYGPPEREAQGRGLMKREKGRGADNSTENTKCKGRRWENRGGGRERWEKEGN